MDSRGIDICTCTHYRSQHPFIRTVEDPVGGEVCLGQDCTCTCTCLGFFPHPQPDPNFTVPEPPVCECCGIEVECKDNCAPYGTQCGPCGECLMFHDDRDSMTGCCVEDERHPAHAGRGH